MVRKMIPEPREPKITMNQYISNKRILFHDTRITDIKEITRFQMPQY